MDINNKLEQQQGLQYGVVPPQQVFVMQDSTGQHAAKFGPQPARVTCPSCGQNQMSAIKYESTTKTHLIALVLCMISCCCCIPYLMNSCKNANHYCANCDAYLGTYNN